MFLRESPHLFLSKYSMRIVTLLASLSTSFCLEDKLKALLGELPSLPHDSLLETLDKSTYKTTSIGRRRTVQDTDCDMQIDQIDSIEHTCSVYRYQAFQNFFVEIMNVAYNDSSMLDHVSTLKDRYQGGDFNFDGSIQATFNQQRDAVYGPNGTCTNPKPGGLTTIVDGLTKATFSMISSHSGSYDSFWTNLDRMQKYVDERFTKQQTAVANTTARVMEQMNKFQALMYTSMKTKTADMVTSINNDSLKNVSDVINGMSEALGDLTHYLNVNYTDFRQTVDPVVDRVLDRLDVISSQFLGADGEFAAVLQNLATQVNPLLVAIPGREASDPMNALKKKGERMVADFASSSNRFVNDSQLSWEKTIQSSIQASIREQVKHTDYMQQGQSQIETLFNETEEGMNGNFSDVDSTMRMQMNELRDSADDLKAMVWTVSSRVNNVNSNLQSMFDALEGVGGSSAGDLRERIGKLLSSSGEASATQLQAILSSFATVKNKVASSNDANARKLVAAVSNVRSRVARAGTSQAGASGDVKSTISSQAKLSSKLTDVSTRSQEALIRATSKTLLRNADGTAANLDGAASDFASEKSGAKRDMQSALSDVSDVLSSQYVATDLQTKDAELNVVETMADHAMNITGAASAADNTLKNAGVSVSQTLGAVTTVGQSIAAAGAKGSEAATSMEEQLGSLDDSIADNFGKSTSGVLNAATGQAENSEETVEAEVNKEATGFSNRLKSLIAAIDGMAGSANGKLNEALGAGEEASSDLGYLDSILGDLVKGSTKNKDSAIQTASDSLMSIITGALTGVQSLGTKIDSSATETDSEISIEAGKVIRAALEAYLARVNNIKSEASSVSSTLGQSSAVVTESKIQLDQNLEKAADLISRSLGDLDEVKSLVEEDSIEKEVSDVRKSVGSSYNELTANLTNLEASAGEVTQNMTSTLPQEFTEALSAVVSEALRDTDIYNSEGSKSVRDLQAIGANASAGSMGVLSGLDTVSQSWRSGYDSALQSALAISRGRVGELGSVADDASGISSLMSLVGGNRANLAADAGRLSDMAQSELQQTVADLMTSIRASKSSLKRASTSASAQATFDTTVNNGIANQFLNSLQQEAHLAARASKDSSDAIDQTSGRASMDIKRIEGALAADQQDRQARMAAVMGNVSSMESELTKAIADNKDAMSIQLMMSRRAVRDILNSWNLYSDFQTKKFVKMGSVDEETVRMNQRMIDNSQTESDAKLLQSRNSLDMFSSDLQNMIADYLTFTNSTGGQLSLLSLVVPLLNSSATGSISQLSESAFQLNRRDGDIDTTARNETLTALKDFEASLDTHAKMAIEAASGNLLSALAGG